MSYPQVMSERETIEQAAAGRSLSRFGDGELRLAIGADAISQSRSPGLALALRRLLRDETAALVCLPNIATTNLGHWHRYRNTDVLDLLSPGKLYGSAFITRPDSAPWIDTPEYWGAVRDLWRERDVILVVGDDKSLRERELIALAKSVSVINGPARDAYAAREHLLAAVLASAGAHERADVVVLLCLGAAATLLADDIAEAGYQALDLGHIGQFMRHEGAFDFVRDALISNEYRAQNVELHRDPRGFGGDGKKHAEPVLAYAKAIGARAILDYGCGEGTLKVALKAAGWERSVQEYDPAMKGRDHLPKPADLVVCSDVLEHIEPDRLDAVLRHLHRLTGIGAYLVIATRPANKILPDGRNAHLIQQPAEWWLAKITEAGFTVTREERRMKGDFCRDVTVWATP